MRLVHFMCQKFPLCFLSSERPIHSIHQDRKHSTLLFVKKRTDFSLLSNPGLFCFFHETRRSDYRVRNPQRTGIRHDLAQEIRINSSEHGPIGRFYQIQKDWFVFSTKLVGAITASVIPKRTGNGLDLAQEIQFVLSVFRAPVLLPPVANSPSERQSESSGLGRLRLSCLWPTP